MTYSRNKIAIFLTIFFASFVIYGEGCSEDRFKCDVDTCIPKSYLCDNEYDCNDHTDEKNCDQSVEQTSDSSFQCNSGYLKCDHRTCYAEKFRCDGDFDCDDQTDEKDCYPSATSERYDSFYCEDNQFKCANNEKCIPESYKCDRDADCADESDEDPELCGGAKSMQNIDLLTKFLILSAISFAVFN